jgi:predicted DCC family thiol-disulfide oxidoreductase YuxK
MGATSERTMPPPSAVVLFDGICNVCNASVNFIIDRDAAGYFRFATLQSDAAKPYLRHCSLPSDFLEGVLLWEDGRCFTRSTAILRILRRLGGIWVLPYALMIVPRFLRDAAYDWFIRRRYRWFGKRDKCRVPTPEVQARFLPASPSRSGSPTHGAAEYATAGQVERMVTPLQPKRFFRGVWTGNGELIIHPLLRWFAPIQRLRMTSEPVWLSDSIWVVKDRFESSSGRVMERKMFAELTAPDRIHVTADDMPLGADILLHESGFRFTPYYAVVRHRGFTFRVRCLDENTIDHEGFIYDLVRMHLYGFPVATMRIGPVTRHVSDPSHPSGGDTGP